MRQFKHHSGPVTCMVFDAPAPNFRYFAFTTHTRPNLKNTHMIGQTHTHIHKRIRTHTCAHTVNRVILMTSSPSLYSAVCVFGVGCFLRCRFFCLFSLFFCFAIYENSSAFFLFLLRCGGVIAGSTDGLAVVTDVVRDESGDAVCRV